MWWKNAETLQAVTTDFVVGELQRAGVHSGEAARSDASAADRVLSDPAAHGLASLPFLDMASRFSRSLGLDRTGLADLLLARRSLQGWTETAARSLAVDDTHLGFHSSGSTGNPVCQEHSLAFLMREVRHFSEVLQATDRVTSLVPSHHIYGFLWSVLLPERLGCPVERLSPARSLPGSLAARCREHDVVVGTPDLWRRMLEQNAALPQHFTAISSTAPLGRDTAALFRSRFPGARLIEAYGSTETAGIAWREGAASDWSLLPWWSFGAASDRAASRQPDHIVDRDNDRRYPLNDHVECTTGHLFKVLGRRDPVIQIGGHNVNLGRVRERLLENEDVSDAAVRPGQDSLRLFLQLRSRPLRPQDWCLSFQRWLNETLPDVPPASSIIIGERLPRNAMSKLSDWQAEDFPTITGRFRHAWPESLDSPAGLQ